MSSGAPGRDSAFSEVIVAASERERTAAASHAAVGAAESLPDERLWRNRLDGARDSAASYRGARHRAAVTVGLCG